MKITKKVHLLNFCQLMAAVFLMFFFAVTLGEPTAELVLKMNDKALDISILERVMFWFGAIVFSAFWSLIWVWFKKSEKVCIEYWLNK